MNCYIEDQFDGTSLIALLPTAISAYSINVENSLDSMPNPVPNF